MITATSFDAAAFAYRIQEERDAGVELIAGLTELALQPAANTRNRRAQMFGSRNTCRCDRWHHAHAYVHQKHMTPLRYTVMAVVAHLSVLAAAIFLSLSPTHAQTQKPHLQEEGIDPTAREILRGKPDAGNPKYVAALRRELEVAVKRQMTDPQRIDALIMNLFGQQISESKMVILRRNLREVALSEGFYNRLVNISLPMLQANVPLDQMKSVVSSTFMRLQAEGMRRLSEQDIELFILYSLEFIRTIPPQLCKRLVNSDVSQQEAAYLERQYVAARSDEEFRRVIDMYYRAAKAELNDSPSPPAIEADEYAAAQKVFGDALVKRMLRSYSAQDVSRILQDTSRASATEACDFGKAVYMTIQPSSWPTS